MKLFLLATTLIVISMLPSLAMADGYSVGGTVFNDHGMISGNVTKYDTQYGSGSQSRQYNTYQHNPQQYYSRNSGCGYGRGYCSKGITGQPVGLHSMKSANQYGNQQTTISGGFTITK